MVRKLDKIELSPPDRVQLPYSPTRELDKVERAGPARVRRRGRSRVLIGYSRQRPRQWPVLCGWPATFTDLGGKAPSWGDVAAKVGAPAGPFRRSWWQSALLGLRSRQDRRGGRPVARSWQR